MAILAVMFCLGLFSTLAQVLLAREMLVAFYGNEITIGTILGAWFAGIGIGAASANRGLRLRGLASAGALRMLLSGLLVVLAILLPLQMHAVRVLRLALGIPFGEYARFAFAWWSAILILLPTGFSIGMFFPAACKLRSIEAGSDRTRDAFSVSRIYAIESLGSMIGGILMTYGLLPWLTPFRIAFLASSAPLAGAAILVRGRWGRPLGIAAAAGVWAVALHPGVSRIEWRQAEARWQAFGALPRDGSTDRAGPRLRASLDSVYENLAVVETAGQFSLYGNGQVMFAFPDPAAYELKIHSIMAQKPAARRVLLIGGNIVGDVPEILKYPVSRLVYVEIDPQIGRLVERFAPAAYRRTISDPRLTYMAEDGVRFVGRCRETFDVILLNAPQPVTAAANRFYTREFFRNLRRILAPGGFVHTTVIASERLASESLHLSASIYQTLKDVFPVLLVTAEAHLQFFGGDGASDLTFDRETLCRRSRDSGVAFSSFHPEYFLGADEIAPDKTQRVRQQLGSVRVPANTNLRPVAYFYNLVLWSRYSGSRMESLLHALERFRADLFGGIVFGIALIPALAMGIGRRRLSPPAAARWMRSVIGGAVVLTGFCGIALEILLLFVFQAFCGYVYAQMGLIFAVFMLGLALGAWGGRHMAAGPRERSWTAMIGLEVELLAFPIAVLLWLRSSLGGAGATWPPLSGLAVYLGVALTGWATGAQFPVANRLFWEAGSRIESSTSVTDSADHFGAAAGSLVLGVVFIPILGIQTACVMLATLKGASLIGVLAAAWISPNARE